MAMRQPRRNPEAKVLETGNVAFFYDPLPGVAHPQSSDQIAHASFALFPDDQNGHQNRLFTLIDGYFPPVILGVDLPAERGWAFVAAVSHDPRAVLDSLLDAAGSAGPVARAVGIGRYLIARQGDHTYLAYALSQPGQLGPAQQTLLLDPGASYVIVVQEPAMPFVAPLAGKPAYPDALSETFDGHGAIPSDPTDLLDYRWTRVLLVGAQRDVKAELGVAPNPRVQNDAAKAALEFLRERAKQINATWQVEILKPLRDGELV